MDTQLQETEVLVIGGGLAGCWAAIKAASLGKKVTLVDKAKVARSGASTFINQILAPTPPGELSAWKKELVERGEYLNDQEWVEVVLKEEKDRIQDLIDWGVPFERTTTGELFVKRGRGHGVSGVVLCNGHTLMDIMRKKALKCGVTLVERTVITGLLTSDGKLPTGGFVCGAVGFHARTGEPVIFKAGAVVITSGQIGSKLRCHFVNNLSGDGVAMALRAGAELINMEFCTAGNISYFERSFHSGSQALLVGMGAKFINKNGERFMLRYDPEMAEKSKLSTLVQAFANEALQNRGPCYWDMTGFSEEDIAMVRRLLPTTLRPYDELNIDIRKKPVECSPIVQICSSCGEGGIRIDISCRSSVEGLYAAGAAARNPVHGVYSVGGVNLAFCNVAGYRAGETAARSVAKNPDKEIILNQAKVTLKNNFTPLGRKEGFTPDDVVKEFQNIVIPAKVSILKNESRINETLNKLKVLKETKLAAMAAKDIHELVKALEAQNLVEIAEIVFLAALQRKESRAWHFREEYPDRNDKEWLKWVIAQKGNDGKTKFRIENIPVENYEFRIANPGSSPHPLTLGNKK